MLPTNNFTVLYHSQTQNDTVANGTLFGSFSSSSATSTVFQENIDLNATKYPYIEVSVTTAPNYTPTSGFAFGLRFVLRLTDGSIIQPLNDQLPIEHVPSGEPATLKVYVPNYAPNIQDIIGLRLYTEERAGIKSTYSLHIDSIVASSLNRVPNCSSAVCSVSLELSNDTGYIDTLVADVVYSGQSSYKMAFSYGGQMFFSRSYSNGSSHISITAISQNIGLQNLILASTPLIPTTVYFISDVAPASVQIRDLKLTFTPIPSRTTSSIVPFPTDMLLLFAELLLVFGLPAELLVFRPSWRVGLIAGVIIRVMIMPWTGHPQDTLTYIRTAYLWYHQGWAPIFYNPPTIFALSVPVGSMQVYYLLGLDRIDPSFLFHYGGTIATFFVKLPFLLADVTTAVILSRISQNRTYAMFYFLNPFSIYVSAVWGQYEGLTTMALVAGYAAIVKLKPRSAIFAGLGGFLLAGLVELFGFLAIPFLAVYLAIKKLYLYFAIPLLVTLVALLIPSSLSQYVFSVQLSSSILQPGVYSLSGSFGISSQLPFITGLTASLFLGLYALIRTSVFLNTLAPIAAAIISFELFANNHPQVMLIPLGLVTILFIARNDVAGLAFVWFCGTVLAFISIVGTQSFAYLLTGEGYYMIPLIEGGQHLKFYALGLLIVNVGLLARAYRKFPLVLTSLVVVALIGLGWLLVNFV